ncbi:glycoside hydrolase family 88/105 protein [Paenibacillus methanolicus]|uniref:Unsaturated rhamnogalacturonyl hydrolase n=1 Tax=Paenibacillus methanolicus TaxID=582686 RepID=A0A5S5CDU0_9BACL|nr:glycoside hydrolase family 88 protein [Paenibacillus methanolicus]TYP76486.1 unsaturated rhamnogalacturonyl hydrolase [Paenibacillus methanolicus]
MTTNRSLYLSAAETARRVYGAMLQGKTGSWSMDMNGWDWVPGVGVIAIGEYARRSGQAEIMEGLDDWARRNIGKSERLRVINAVAPFAVLPELYAYTGNSVYEMAAARAGQWLTEEAPRTKEGAWEHTVTEDVKFAEQVWADTVFMAVLVLARVAKMTGNRAFAEEAVHQLLLHMRLLQDEATSLMFHGWNCEEGHPMSGARWTRANAWVAAGIPMIAEAMEGLASLPKEIIDRYRELMGATARYQRGDGLWPTVLDRPEFYPETSGSAGIAYGMKRGIHSGWLDAGLAAQADLTLKAVLDLVPEDGIVQGVSGGTPVMDSIEAYNSIPRHPTLYGQGLVLMLLSEYR